MATRGDIVRYRYRPSARPAPTMMPLSRCGANARVAIKVATAAMPSCLLACQACLTALRFTSPITAMIMMAASTACGRWYSTASVQQVSSTKARYYQLMPVLAPAFMLTAERGERAQTGICLGQAAST